MLLAVSTALTMAACGSSDGDKEPNITVAKGVPTYEDNGYIERGAYCMPAKENYAYPDSINGALDASKANYKSNINEQEFKDYKDAGFTFMLTEYDANWEENEKFSETNLYTTMELAEKIGIPVVVHTGPLERYTATNDFRITAQNKEYMQKLVSTLSTYKMFRGFSFKDEPKIEYANTFKAYKDHLTSLKPDSMFFVSYLPIYGAPHLSVSFGNGGKNERDAYIEYVDAYLKAMNSFTYDYYPLRTDNSRKMNYIWDTWYENLDIVATQAKKYEGSKIGITIQTSSFGKPGDPALNTNTNQARTVATKADIGFQMYSSLAYGVKEFGYFTYWVHWGSTDPNGETFYDAMVMPPETNGGPGVKTDCYYAVQAMNNEIAKFDHVLLNYEWQGTMAVAPKGKTKSLLLNRVGKYKNERIKNVSVSEETIIGCLKDKNGFDGYMIVNSTEPSANKTDKVTVSFYKAKKALAYINGEEQTITLKDGSYTFDIGAGEGVFVIPLA